LNINKGNLYNFKDNALINISFDTIEKGLPLLGDNSMSLIKSQSFYQLFINNKLSKNERFAEIHWRISQPICAFLLAFIAFGLAISFGKNKYYLILPSMLLFMVYYNLLMLSRHLTQTGQIHHLIGSMWVHIIFLALAFLLNIKKYKYAR
jgi:lipopolysaccharide export LptBFGC system permease protein LptF